MKRLGLGERGEVSYLTQGTSTIALVYYRDFTGHRRKIKRSGSSKAVARRAVDKALDSVLSVGQGGEFTASSTLHQAASGWLAMFDGQVQRGARSPSTLELYRDAVDRHVVPGIGQLRLGEITTGRVDRFLQRVLDSKGYATAKLTRTVLSGICGWLVRRDALSHNPVRDATPLQGDHDRTPRALTPAQIRDWLKVLDADPMAQRWDLPQLARFILATGLRLGEALAVSWQDVDLNRGVINIEWTVLRLKGQGLVRRPLKTKSSYRVLVLPGWCLTMLRQRRVSRGAFDGPVFPDSNGGFRDRNNVGRAFRQVRSGTDFEWVKPHTYRKTVATLLDSKGATARMIADQLGHARVSMTQDVYMGRRAVNSQVAEALNTFDPDRPDAQQDE
jgi:integrase